MSRVKVLGVGFDNFCMEDAVTYALELIEQRKAAYVVTPNPEIVMMAQEHQELKDTIESADIVLPDGIGIIYGAKILGTPIQGRVPGIDFASELMKKLSERNGRVYLLGAKPGVAHSAGMNLQEKFPGLRVVGSHDGYFTDDGPIVEEINSAKPDLLFVCLGFPKQEIWMREHSKELDVGLMAGLGGSLDVFAGVVRRAPIIWQKLGLEWLYRLLHDPKRIGRMMKLPLFLMYVLKERVKK